MSLNAAACAAEIYTEYQKVIDLPVAVDYPSLFAAQYEAYAVAGVVAGVANNGGDESIIEAELRAAPTTPEELGIEFMQYWATAALVPEAPNLSVVNDALAFEAEFIAAVYDSLTTTARIPPFEDFITNIEEVAKMVTWTITPPPPAVPFTSGIS